MKKKYLSVKHFKKIIDSLKKVYDINDELVNKLVASYGKNYLSNTKGRSSFTKEYPDLNMKEIASYSFETKDYKIDKLNACYLAIRFYHVITDKNSDNYGRHRFLNKRFFLGN